MPRTARGRFACCGHCHWRCHRHDNERLEVHGKRLGKWSKRGWQNNSLSPAWPDRLHSEFHLQSRRAGDQFSRRTHLAADPSHNSLLDRKSYEEAAALTLRKK